MFKKSSKFQREELANLLEFIEVQSDTNLEKINIESFYANV